MNKEKCLVFPACLVRYMCLAFCVWIIQSKPPWMYIYGAGSQRKYIRTLLITSFDPQFPRPKLLPTNRYHKEIRSPLGSNCRHAALSQEKRKPRRARRFSFFLRSITEVFFLRCVTVPMWYTYFPKKSISFRFELSTCCSQPRNAALSEEKRESNRERTLLKERIPQDKEFFFFLKWITEVFFFLRWITLVTFKNNHYLLFQKIKVDNCVREKSVIIWDSNQGEEENNRLSYHKNQTTCYFKKSG